MSLIPVTPKRPQPLPKWIEANVRLPAGVAAEPGPIKLYPYQCGIAAAIADPQIERVFRSEYERSPLPKGARASSRLARAGWRDWALLLRTVGTVLNDGDPRV